MLFELPAEHSNQSTKATPLQRVLLKLVSATTLTSEFQSDNWKPISRGSTCQMLGRRHSNRMQGSIGEAVAYVTCLFVGTTWLPLWGRAFAHHSHRDSSSSATCSSLCQNPIAVAHRIIIIILLLHHHHQQASSASASSLFSSSSSSSLYSSFLMGRFLQDPAQKECFLCAILFVSCQN